MIGFTSLCLCSQIHHNGYVSDFVELAGYRSSTPDMSAIEGYQRPQIKHPQINIKSTRSLLTYRNAAEIRANLCWLTLMSKKEDTKPDPTRKIFYLYLSIELHSIAFFSYALQKAYTQPTSKSTKSFKKLWLLTSNVNPTSFFTTETSNVNPTSFFTTDVPTQKNKQLNFKNEFACKPISHGLENDALINPQTHQSLQGLL
ncbi:hypothetical protein MJO28_004817 [Puccinia striiformis f. sp. tritici]|uniref:Uncharacterized protein n=1 Tax=Puccinia striiformis f. sp. tritici TaxID=168172 RepID=A0ACC0EK71_9BASI|nr:hypothetical protein MJO28_004817 [Puccinia striiformis f. sp. tritici]